jgi:hypothetical protein
MLLGQPVTRLQLPRYRMQQFMVLTIGAMAGTATGLVILAFANTRDRATTLLLWQSILAGILVPELPDLARAVARIAVSGY